MHYIAIQAESRVGNPLSVQFLLNNGRDSALYIACSTGYTDVNGFCEDDNPLSVVLEEGHLGIVVVCWKGSGFQSLDFIGS